MTHPPADRSTRAATTPPPVDAGGGVPVLSYGWPFLLTAMALLAVGLSSWRPVPAGVWHDDGVYMVVGQALAGGEGLVYGGVPGAPPAVKFPPAYSALLAGLWAVLPGVGAVTFAATLLNLLLLSAAGGGLGWLLHRQAGLSRAAAAVGAGVAFLSADLWRLALVPLSESLFIGAMVAALLLWPGAVEGRRRDVGLLAAVLTVAVLTRSAAAALVAGVAASLLIRRAWGPALAATTPAVLAFLGWSSWSRSRAPALTPGTEDVLGPYGGWLAGQVLGSPGAFLGGLPLHAVDVARRVLALLVPGGTGWVVGALAVPLAAVGLLGAVHLVRRAPAVPWVAAFYLAMLMVWPFADRRLVAPVHPLLVACIVAGAWVLAERKGRGTLRRVGLAFVVVWAGTFVVVSSSRVARSWAVAPYHLRAERLAAAVSALERVAPPDAVVGAPEFWAALHLHGGWSTTPSALFRPRADEVGTPVWGTPDDQLRLWLAQGVTHLLLEQGGQVHGEALNRLEEACPGAATIPARLPPQMIVRIEWTEGCVERLGIRE